MVIEIKGQQLRIRVKSPNQFSMFRTKDVGKKGRLQIIIGLNKKSKKWDTQSYRLNILDYSNKDEVIKEVKNLQISSSHKSKAIKLISRWKK